MPTEINRTYVSQQDGIPNLKLEERPLPKDLKPDEVLVKIHSVALNFRDTEVVMGLYNHHKSDASARKPVVPCADACGTVVSIGSGVTRLKEGDKVLSIFNQGHIKGQIKPEDMLTGLGLPLDGVLCEYRVFGQEGLVKKPEGLGDEEAVTLPIAGVTAWMAINTFRPLGQWLGKDEEEAKDTVVLLQGTGGVSIMGLLIAKAAGAKVIITSSSDEKLERAKKLGADHGINYKKTPNWADEVMRLTNGVGADIIFENGGAKTLRQSFECVKFGGQIHCIGYLSGKVEEDEDRTAVNVLALKRNVTLKGMLNGPRERFEELAQFVEEKGLKPVIDRVFKFEEAKEALEYLYSGSHFGKVIVKVD